jgi:hypothetical protein
MGSDPAWQTIQILRRAVSDVERELDQVSDAELLAQLKRIMGNAIAELEMIAIREAEGGKAPPS